MTLSVCQCLDVPQTQPSDESSIDDREQCVDVEMEDSAAGRCLMQCRRLYTDSDVKECFISVETNDTSTFAVTSERNLVSIRRQGLSCHVERVLSGFKVSSVSCGKCHTLVLSAIGVVFSCGVGNQGQLGHGSLDSEPSLRVVEALEGVRMTAVSAGGWHSMALSDGADLYVWGWNECGQLGLSCDALRQSSDSLITSRHDPRDVVDINSHCIINYFKHALITVLTHILFVLKVGVEQKPSCP